MHDQDARETGRRPRAADDDVAAKGREPAEGRPSGVPSDARPASEGRPAAVRHAEPQRTPPAHEMPTEDAVDRGETAETEHEPGGDL